MEQAFRPALLLPETSASAAEVLLSATVPEYHFPVVIRKLLLFVATLATICSAQESRTAEDNVPRPVGVPAVLIEQIGCFGECPDYEVEIYADGLVIWHGHGYVDQLGTAMKRIDASSVRQLFAKWFGDADKAVCAFPPPRIIDAPDEFLLYSRTGDVNGLRPELAALLWYDPSNKDFKTLPADPHCLGFPALISRLETLANIEEWINVTEVKLNLTKAMGAERQAFSKQTFNGIKAPLTMSAALIPAHEQAVIVTLMVDPQADADRLHALEEQLSAAIKDGSGEFDGGDCGVDNCVLYMYGPSADRLFDATIPIIKDFHPAAGSYLIKRYGEPGAREERVELGSEAEQE